MKLPWPRRRRTAPDAGAPATGERHRDRARASLAALRDDPAIPPAIRQQLAADFAEVETLLGRLERGDLHIAVFGRVSVGKSALLNALAGRALFEVGVLHGTTTVHSLADWRESGAGKVVLVDTPGIDELDGDAREQLAFEVAGRADLLMFVVEGDPVRVEREALDRLLALQRPLLLVLNKADRFPPETRARLLTRLRELAGPTLPAENVIAVAALPAPLARIERDARGGERRHAQAREPEIAALQSRLLEILEREGRSLAALNAGLFAGQLVEQVAQRVAALRRDQAARVIRGYCLAKGVTVALNPVPVADLVAAAGLDIALVVHLGRVYGQPLSRREAGRVIATIAAQLAGLMAGLWAINLGASALKAVSAGLSTAVTAGAQGALGWYATLVVGRVVERWLLQGRQWGPDGPGRVVREILDSLDRGSVLREARTEILARIRRPARRG
ncbi:MAG: GTP-binding protein [Xanthomonadales bacterium]|nr:GTP-binding protein [Xanthomonadales bacterium]